MALLRRGARRVLRLYPIKVALVLIIPSLALYLFFTIWPITYSIYLAFTNAAETNIAPNPDYIRDLENAKACVYNANETREEIQSRALEAYESVVDARAKLTQLYDKLNKAVEENRSITPIELMGLTKVSREAYKDVYRAADDVKGLFVCNTTYAIISPYIEGNLSAAASRLANDVVKPLESKFMKPLTPSEARGIRDAVNDTIVRINLTLTSIEVIAKDFDGFIKSVLDSIDQELDRLKLKTVGLKNVDELLHDSRFIYSIFKTLLFVLTSVPLKVAVGVALAFFFSSELIYGRKIMRALLLTPWAIPTLLSVTTWRMLFEPGAFLQQTFSYLTGHKFLILNNEWDAFILYNIVEMWLAYPFIMTVTMGAIAGIPKEIIEATYIDGASVWLRFRKVLLPQVMRPVLFATVLTTGASLQAFMVPLLINGGGPSGSISVLGLEPRYGNLNEFLILYGYNRAYIDREYGLAAAVYLVVVVFLAIYVLAWLKLTRGGRGR